MDFELHQDLFMIGRLKTIRIDTPTSSVSILSLYDFDRMINLVNKHIMIQSDYHLKDLKTKRLQILEDDKKYRRENN